MKRKLVSLALILVLILAMAPAASAAALSYPAAGGSIYFDAAAGAITGCDETVTAAEIPTEIYGVTVTSIGSNARQQSLFQVRQPYQRDHPRHGHLHRPCGLLVLHITDQRGHPGQCHSLGSERIFPLSQPVPCHAELRPDRDPGQRLHILRRPDQHLHPGPSGPAA